MNVPLECPHCGYSTAQTYKMIEHTQKEHGQ